MNIESQASIKGRFSIEVQNTKTGKVTKSPMQDNLVLDQIMQSSFFTNSYLNPRLYLGSGSTPPQRTDTTLESALGSNYLSMAGYTDKGETISDSPPLSTKEAGGVYRYTINMRFTNTNPGHIQGNAAELGIFAYSSNSSSSRKFATRALIKDPQGNPSTISLGEFDVLTVYYEMVYEIKINPNGFINSVVVDIDGVPTTINAYQCNYEIPIEDSFNVDSTVLRAMSYSEQTYVRGESPTEYNSTTLRQGPFSFFWLKPSSDVILCRKSTGDPIDFSDLYNSGNNLIEMDSLSNAIDQAVNSGATSVSISQKTPYTANPGTLTDDVSYILLSDDSRISSDSFRKRVTIALEFDPPIAITESTYLSIDNLSFTISKGV